MPCTVGKRSSEGHNQGRALFRTAPLKCGDMRSWAEGRKEAGQVLGPQEGVAPGPVGRRGGHLLACILGMWEVPMGAGKGRSGYPQD